jgi:hypothetical protein
MLRPWCDRQPPDGVSTARAAQVDKRQLFTRTGGERL